MTLEFPKIPRAFLWKRWHSLAGLWLVGFLIIHLLTNSQAALWIGENGEGFVKSVNDIHSLPYLDVIEILLLAVPFFLHIIWGIQSFQKAKYNSFITDGTAPELPQYSRNQAYSWQRITAWLLLLLITLHVIQMRFMEYPAQANVGSQHFYMTRVEADPGIYTLAERLNVDLYNSEKIANQKQHQQQQWIVAIEQRPIHEGQLIAVAKDFGTAELLMVRETFKNPWMLFLYTVLVLSACFHAFNGLWTALITWGLTLSPHSQHLSRIFANTLMFIVTFLGLAAIWGTYWFNLKQ